MFKLTLQNYILISHLIPYIFTFAKYFICIVKLLY